MSDWTKIYTTSFPWKAELIEGLLKDNGIPCVIMNKQDSVYLFGQLELYVPQQDVITAMSVLETSEE